MSGSDTVVTDNSALMAVLQDEPEAGDCRGALQTTEFLVISAGTLAEALIVAGSRGVQDEMLRLIDELSIQVVPITRNGAVGAAAAYSRWGKGRHPAALNFGDCLSYALAVERGCPLLFVGNGFARTDVARPEKVDRS